MIIEWKQFDNGSDVEEFLIQLFDTYKNVEILGITEDVRFNVFYKLGKRKEEKQEMGE
jgi:hypothetical protein